MYEDFENHHSDRDSAGSPECRQLAHAYLGDILGPQHHQQEGECLVGGVDAAALHPTVRSGVRRLQAHAWQVRSAFMHGRSAVHSHG